MGSADDTDRSAAPTRTQPPARAATVLAALTVVPALGLLGLAGLLAYETATDTSDDALVGVGYVFAVIFGVPALAGLVLAGSGFALRRRDGTRALVMASLGLACVLVVALFWVQSVYLP